MVTDYFDLRSALADAEGIEQLRATVEAAQEAGTVSPDLDASEEAHALIAFIDGVSVSAACSPRLWTSARQLEHLDRYRARLG